MTAWGVGAFENDHAADWLYELEESVDETPLVEAFDRVLNGDRGEPDYLASILGLAAAETIAAWGGRAAPDAPIEMLGWVAPREEPPPELVKFALTVTSRVMLHSELRRSWNETDFGATWEQAVVDLQRRLGTLTESLDGTRI